jgi:hypothetical protein
LKRIITHLQEKIETVGISEAVPLKVVLTNANNELGQFIEDGEKLYKWSYFDEAVPSIVRRSYMKSPELTPQNYILSSSSSSSQLAAHKSLLERYRFEMDESNQNHDQISQAIQITNENIILIGISTQFESEQYNQRKNTFNASLKRYNERFSSIPSTPATLTSANTSSLEPWALQSESSHLPTHFTFDSPSHFSSLREQSTRHPQLGASSAIGHSIIQGRDPPFYAQESEEDDLSLESPLHPVPPLSRSVNVVGQWVIDYFRHAVRQQFRGTRFSMQNKILGLFVKPAGVGMGNLRFCLPGSPGCAGALVIADETNRIFSALGLSDLQELLQGEMYSLRMPPDLLGVFQGINIDLSHVRTNESGVQGVHGRNRNEGSIFDSEILFDFWKFIKHHQPGAVQITSSLLFEYHSQIVLQNLLAHAKAQRLSLLSSSTTSSSSSLYAFSQPIVTLDDSLFDNPIATLEDPIATLDYGIATLENSMMAPQEILPHKDTSGRVGFRYLKALFMYNPSGESSVWDFYANDGTLIGTAVIPSGSCLFISDFGLGMLSVQRRE